MTGGVLLDPRVVGGLLDGPLHRRVGAMVAADGPAARVLRELRGGKDVLPPPLGCRIGILLRDGVGEVDVAHAFGTVLLVLGLYLLQVASEGIVEAFGEHGRAVLAALAVPHVNASVSEAEFLDPKTQGLRQAKATAVQEMDDQAIRAGGEGRKEPMHLVARTHRGEAFGPVGAVERPNVGPFEVEHLFVQKDQRTEGLVLGGGRHVAVRRQVVQEGPDVVLVEVVGMGGVVEANEAVTHRRTLFPCGSCTGGAGRPAAPD